jgi:Protein of unknown function (DUF3703)
MKINKMPQQNKISKVTNAAIRNKISEELKMYKEELQKGNRKIAFGHLERIHILSQPFPLRHTIIHVRMLLFAIRFFKPVEILVQFLYSLFSAKFSLLNIFPQGNTGGANAIKKGVMPIPNDLKEFIVNKNMNN